MKSTEVKKHLIVKFKSTFKPQTQSERMLVKSKLYITEEHIYPNLKDDCVYVSCVNNTQSVFAHLNDLEIVHPIKYK